MRQGRNMVYVVDFPVLFPAHGAYAVIIPLVALYFFHTAVLERL